MLLNEEVVEILSETIESSKKADLDYDQVRKAALVFRAVNHKLRQSIIELLRNHKQLVVTEIYVKLRLEQSVASQHLAILRRAGVVKTNREGKYIYYSIDESRLAQIATISNELIK